MTRGQKRRLSELTVATQVQVRLEANAKHLAFDFSCFGVDANGQLSDDRYFVFYNQKSSPENALSLTANGNFTVDLSRLPSTIKKLVFVITVDGDGALSQLTNGGFRLSAPEGEVARFDFVGRDFSSEKAIIAAEIYQKEGWRVAAVGQGFAGGLSALLHHFGGQESDAQPPAPVVAQTAPAIAQAASFTSPATLPKISLDKDKALQLKLEKQAPQLVNLSKILALSLHKKGLQDITARVALVLDASGSMAYQYQRGAVQAVVDRIATLAMRLDDDGELDTWGFASRHARLPSVTIGNVAGYIGQITKKHSMMSIIGNLGVSNNEPPVMREVLEYYRSSPLPALIIFISDGGVGSSNEIKRVLTEASRFPLFWQFVGLGGSSYGVLQDLDTMRGRTVDNANFFHVDDLSHISDEELYGRLLNEFPAWLRAAGAAGIIR